MEANEEEVSLIVLRLVALSKVSSFYNARRNERNKELEESKNGAKRGYGGFILIVQTFFRGAGLLQNINGNLGGL